jgi:hypothetical protein
MLLGPDPPINQPTTVWVAPLRICQVSPQTVGTPGRGDWELAVQHGGPTQRHLRRQHEEFPRRRPSRRRPPI